MPAPLLKLTRQVHLYLGVFISPMLLFFAFTGAMQVLMLHETIAGRSYVPPKWLMTLAQIHKNQTSVLAPRKVKLIPGLEPSDKPVKADKQPKTENVLPAAGAPAQPPAPPVPVHRSAWPEKVFFVLVSFGLFTSTLTGIYMAYKYNRNRWIVSALLLAGIVVPLVLLPF